MRLKVELQSTSDNSYEQRHIVNLMGCKLAYLMLRARLPVAPLVYVYLSVW